MLVTLGILCGQAGLARGAGADPGKLAVLIFGTDESDAALALNVSEVVIARLAERERVDLVGTGEFKIRLGVDSDRRARSCLDEPACLARAAVSLGVRRMVTGTVGTRGKQYLFSLALYDPGTGKTANRVFRAVDGPVENLIRDVRSAADEILRLPPAPARMNVRSDVDQARVSIDGVEIGLAPVRRDLAPGLHWLRVDRLGHFPWASQIDVTPGAQLDIEVTRERMPERRLWPTFAAVGTAGGAGLALAAGIVLGVAAQVTPTPAPASRAEAQADFEHRQRLGLLADASFVSAGILAVASGYLFLRYRHHILGKLSEP